MNFIKLLGAVPRGSLTVEDIVIAGVSVTKEGLVALSTSDRLKLTRVAREGGEDKFIFFESNGKVGRDFWAVRDIYMRLDALPKHIKYYNMHEMFNVLSRKTVLELEENLDVLFVAQAAVTLNSEALNFDPDNIDLAVALTSAQASEAIALLDLDAVDLVTTNLLANHKIISKEEVKVSKRCYSHHGQDYSVET